MSLALNTIAALMALPVPTRLTARPPIHSCSTMSYTQVSKPIASELSFLNLFYPYQLVIQAFKMRLSSALFHEMSPILDHRFKDVVADFQNL